MVSPGKLRSIADGATEAGFPSVGGAIREAAAEIERLRSGLSEMLSVEIEPCRYDHNGFCQSHYSGRPCRVEVARAALGNCTVVVKE